MLYYFHVNLPFTVDLQHLLPTNHKVGKTGHFKVTETIDQQLHEFMLRRQVLLKWAEIFYTAPESSSQPHVDGINLSNSAKLNFTYGAVGSKMCWWRQLSNEAKEALPTWIGTSYLRYMPHEVGFVCAAQIKQPTVVNSGQPHSVINPTDEGRWTVSITLADPTTRVQLSVQQCHERLGHLS